MTSRKRPAAEPLLPLHSAKQPRTRMVGYDGGNPSPSEDVGLLSRWKSIWRDVGVLAIETAEAFIGYRPQRDTVEDLLPSIPSESDGNQSVSGSHFPNGNTFKSDASTSQKTRGLGEPHLLPYSPSLHSHRSTSQTTTQPPQAPPIPGSSACYTHSVFKQINRSQPLHQYDTIPRKFRHREHIFAKAHKANVKAEKQRAREAMQRQLFAMKRNRGYTSDFSEFQSLLAFQARLEKLEQKGAFSPFSSMVNLHAAETSPSRLRHSSSDDIISLEFLQRTIDRAQATLNEPKPPRPFQPTFDQLKLSQRRRDLDIEERLRPKLIPPTPLPPEDDARVDVLLRKRGIVAKFAREQVSDNDLCRLRPSQWLNDEIINFYGAMILARSEECKENPPKTRIKGRKVLNVHYFSTFFWPKLKEGYEKGRLAKWTKKVDIFAKDVVLVPVNHSNAHWTSAAINFRRKRIESYDSMGTRRGFVFKMLRSYLDAEHRNKKKAPFDFTGWEDYSIEEPVQENGFDCGVFTCQFLQGLSRGDDAVRFTQRDMPFLRRRMIWEIGNATLRDDP